MRLPTPQLLKTIIAISIYYAFFGFCIAIFLYRGGIESWANFPFVHSFLHNQHISNFALSGILFLGAASYPAARQQYRAVGVVAFFVIALNLYIENGRYFFNVADPIDALAGILGVIFGLLAIWLIKTFGTISPNSRQHKS